MMKKIKCFRQFDSADSKYSGHRTIMSGGPYNWFFTSIFENRGPLSKISYKIKTYMCVCVCVCV